MLRQLTLLVIVLVLSAAAFAQDLNTELLRAVTANLTRSNVDYCGSKKVIASLTRPSETARVSSWLQKNRSDVIATEIGQSFERENASPHTIEATEVLPYPLAEVKFSQEGRPEWEALHQTLPEIKCVVAFAAPAVETTETFGVVRYDLHLDNGRGTTYVFDLDRAASGKWEITLLSSGMYLPPAEERRVFRRAAE